MTVDGMLGQRDLSALQADLVEMLAATKAAERDIYATLDAELRDRQATIGDWSAKDVRGHLAAWRAVEARRLQATSQGAPYPVDDPPLDEAVDESNARLHTARADWTWEQVSAEAGESYEALRAAIGMSSTNALCECLDTIVGIGANGTNHGMAHLMDVAKVAHQMDRYDTLAGHVAEVLARGHLPPRDSGVMLYNIACRHALEGELDDARRLLRTAFAHRHDLVDFARDDEDLAALRGELESLLPA